MKTKKNCLLKTCGKEFETYKNGKYCSRKCAYEDRENIYSNTRKCLWCDKEFRAKKSVSKRFCSVGCSRRYNHNGKISLNEYKTKHKLRAYVGGYINRHGYICILKPDHPNACRGYVYEHRYVMEQKLGRLLTSNEIVHHKDGNKTNNKISNLEIVTRKMHRSLIYSNIVCPHCKKSFEYEAHSQNRPKEIRLEGL